MTKRNGKNTHAGERAGPPEEPARPINNQDEPVAAVNTVLDEEHVLERTGLTQDELVGLIKDGLFPPPISLQEDGPVWVSDDVTWSVSNRSKKESRDE